MFERFTEQARCAVFYARYEAARSTPPIEPEHLLLGVLRDESTIVRRFLGQHGIDVEALRHDLEAFWLDWRDKPMVMDVPLSSRSKNVLRLAAQESASITHLGLEHILLAILTRRSRNHTGTTATDHGAA
jgi:ATP-dependent Clp protease ATP-binding subunit ClpC